MNESFIKAYDGLPILLKLILALPVIDGVSYGIYRVVKGVDRNNTLLLIIGIIWFPFGAAFGWVIDMISIFMHGKVKILA